MVGTMTLRNWEFLKFDYASTGFNGAVIICAVAENGTVLWHWRFAADPHLVLHDDDIRGYMTHLGEGDWTPEPPKTLEIVRRFVTANTPKADG